MSSLNINKQHFEKALNLINCQESLNDKNNEMFYKKIVFNIENFDQFSDNIFYSQNHLEYDNFCKNFCQFIVDMLKAHVDCKILDNLVDLISKNPSKFYMSYLDYMFKIYSYNGFCFSKEKHVKLVDITTAQRNSLNQVTISTENPTFFLEFLIPSSENIKQKFNAKQKRNLKI